MASVGILALVPATPGASAPAMPPPELGQAILSSQVDAASPMAAAQATGRRVEDLTARTESASTYANPNGSWTTEEAAAPYRTQDGEGVWHAIDTTLVTTGDGWEPVASAVDVAFSAGGDATFATYTRPNGGQIGWGWRGALPEPVVSGSTLTYPDVVPGGDLVVTALATGFSHSLVLYAPPVNPISIEVPVELNGADIDSGADGSLTLSTPAGRELVSAPAPLMWDAATGADGTPKNVAAVEVDLEVTDVGTSIVLKPDKGMITDPDTRYPVTIDPTFTAFATGDGWVSSDTTIGHTNSEELRVGYSPSDDAKSRSFLKFSTNAWEGKQVLDATLRLRNFASDCFGRGITVARITEGVNLTQTSWSEQPAVTAVGSDTFYPGYGCPDGQSADWDVTSIVDGWARGSFENYGLRLKADDETINSWRKYRSAEYLVSPAFQPKLIVDYNTPPASAPAVQVTPVTTGTSSTHAAPTLSTRVSDSDAGTVRARFVISDSEGSPVFTKTSPFVASGTVASVIVTPGLLQVGKTYNVKAMANDGSVDASSWSSAVSFTVTEPPPYLVGGEGEVDPYAQYIDGNDDPTVEDDPLEDEDVSLPPPSGDTTSYTIDDAGTVQYFDDSAQTLSGGTWWDGVCTDGEHRYTTVKDYPRPEDHWRMDREYARMYCGKATRYSQEPFSESAFGIRHIRNDPKKVSDFGQLASWQGSTWGHWMHWAIGRTLEYPELRTVQSDIRYCYQGLFYFGNASGKTEKRRVIVILGETGVRIMTAFPRKNPYCQGPSF